MILLVYCYFLISLHLPTVATGITIKELRVSPLVWLVALSSVILCFTFCKSSYNILNVVMCKLYVNSYLDSKVAMGLLKLEVAWDSLVKIL